MTTFITGTVSVRGGEPVTAGAPIQIALLDVSRADAPADVLGSTTVEATGASSDEFRLEYDSSLVSDRRRFSLRASVEQDGRLTFTSTEHLDPFATSDGGPLVVWMTAVPARDASVDGTPLVGTTWMLTEIQGEEAPLGVRGQPATLVLVAEGRTVHGFSGCNRFAGTYEFGADGLRFGPMAGTRRACPDGMELERGVLAALAGVMGHRVDGTTLTLLRAGTDPLLRYAASSAPED
jgi:putative lipoprotein